MAKVEALVSFAGVVTMGIGEVGEISDKDVLSGLVAAGYVKVLEAPKAKEEAKEAEKPKKGTKK